MAKISLTDFASLQFDASATNNLNNNNAAIETAMENTLSRDGTSPNNMNAVLDMNGNRIINLPAPGGASDPVRLQDVTGSPTIALSITLSGDVTSPTGNGILPTTIANNAVTNVKMADNSVGTAEIIAANVTNAKLATQANNTIKSNVSGGVASASDNTLTQVLDSAAGSAQGSVLYRGASSWTTLAPGTSGQFLQTGGASANPIWASAAGGGGTILTPEQFGAVGNGVTNDTTALQNFLTACQNNTGVFTSGKTYMFSGFLFVKDNSYLVGYGSTIKALATAGSNFGNLNITDPTQGTAVGPRNVTIKGLTVNGNAIARRAGGAFSGVGNAAGFYVISSQNTHLYDCKAIDNEADGFYFGGDSTLGDVTYWSSMNNCYAQQSGRNGFSFVGTTGCSITDCVANNITFGDTVGNISYGYDWEPNGATSPNNGFTATGCKAINCTTVGFGSSNGSFNNNLNWVSPYTQSCGIGGGTRAAYLQAPAGGALRIIGARMLANGANFFQCAEAIPSFP